MLLPSKHKLQLRREGSRIAPLSPSQQNPYPGLSANDSIKNTTVCETTSCLVGTQENEDKRLSDSSKNIMEHVRKRVVINKNAQEVDRAHEREELKGTSSGDAWKTALITTSRPEFLTLDGATSFALSSDTVL
ncbi:hypothetical protein DPMN_107297 [Dreissena polymorpha]|uniref:Uncharacterized protein n=1 Tax=Dreissena polymorpha TaxID=45954 RepID=A0A9D4K6R1_DREPO|nr:hypothetical protein DPMN_107297 [Dreissena polymorpha]